MMKKFLLVSIVAGSAMAAVVASHTPHAEACPPMVTPDQSRIEEASEIVVGKVLEVKALESTTQDGSSMTLLQLSVHVADTLRGATGEDSLVTVYVVADADSVTDAVTASDTARDDGEARVASSSSTGNVSLYGQMPEAPVPLQSYVFFARPFGDSGELVLARNEALYLEPADEALVASTRQLVNNFLAYGYIY